MSSRKPQFVNGEIYHIFNRSIEGKNLFQQISNYFRFISCLYEFNNKKLVRIDRHRDERGRTVSDRELLVEIIAFCLMPNHYHLVVCQLVDNGISLFMQKLGSGYVGYFNKRHEREGRGSIFQGKHKAVHVKTNEQFMNLICYVFTNPIGLIEKDWKETGVKNTEEAIKHIESYRWSSYLDCIGKENFPSVTKRDFIYGVFENCDNIKKAVESWILYKSEVNKGFEKIKSLILE